MYQKGIMAAGAATENWGDSSMSTCMATGHQVHSVVGNGALTFDMDYERWVNEHQQLINDLRQAFNSQKGDDDLHIVVEGVTAHYDELLRLKIIGAKADVFHMFNGMWKTPAERCFMWLGGFRSSELLKILRNQLEPLPEQQLMGLYNLQHSSLQAEDALSQGMEALHQSLSRILSDSSTSLGSTSSGNSAQFNMGQIMDLAMTKLHSLEDFLLAADILRQQTVRQLQRILSTRQAARALLVINDFVSQLRNNLRRLAQNHQEATRKGRSGKKGILVTIEYPNKDHSHSVVENGASAFDMDYERWVEEHQHVINNLRKAFNSQMGEDNKDELHIAIVGVTSHYEELSRLKSMGTKADVFHMLSGTWKTPVERCFMWLGGFRSSELVKIIMKEQLEALTEEELGGMYNLQQASWQLEDALSQAMQVLQQSLVETLCSNSFGLEHSGSEYSTSQMALAMSKLASLESIVLQAELLRQQTLKELQRILRTRQAARAFLVINDYISRLRNVKTASSPVEGMPSNLHQKLATSMNLHQEDDQLMKKNQIKAVKLHGGRSKLLMKNKANGHLKSPSKGLGEKRRCVVFEISF
ncbi:transcription factor TGA6-like isoform X2 [Prosopis cineraria]|uniref:transcription factor TGA6-like isoform X2 n=1 Tax=Prosopis cineraria TaxID=364024 RepID=UPI00241030E4|nr:transcription factor TGA6-like isoform X2 [Prosopis cineraria]